MLPAGGMNFHCPICLILLPCILEVVICRSHFELIKNSEEPAGGQDTGKFLHKTFFECDRERTCTHVIKFDGSEEYVIVLSKDALAKMTSIKTVWKKMIINDIYGNIALGKPSLLSSLWRNHTFAALAVDGNKERVSAYCAQSKLEKNAWLRVDLQRSATIVSVSILSLETKNRVMEAFDVRAGDNFQDGGVGNLPCQLNVNIPVNSSAVHVQCPSDTIARYITVNTRGIDYIEICELEVYGYYV